MAGLFLAFASFGKQPVNAVSARGGQFVLGAPDFLEQRVGMLCGRSSFTAVLPLHALRDLAGNFTRGWPDFSSRLLVSANSLSRLWP